jgi:hypothetical protein
VTAVDQLKAMAQRKQYRETAQLLEVTTQSLGDNRSLPTSTINMNAHFVYLYVFVTIGCFAVDPVLPDISKRQTDRRVDRVGRKAAV